MRWLIPFLLILFISFPAWAADNPKPGDFDGAMFYSGREGSLLVLDVPPEVYQGLRQGDLGDIRIFDAAEKPVPFFIRERPGEWFTPAPEEVPFFVWEGGKENNFPANTDIEINTSGGVVRIKNQNHLSGSSPVFLVDLSLLKYSPSKLTVKIENRGNNFNTPVSIHYSGDLSNWRSFDKRQTLASFGGTVQDILELPETTIKNMRYLLITFSRETPPPVNMIAQFEVRERPASYHEAVFQGIKSSDGKKVNYNTESYYPIETIDFILSEADSIPVLIKNRFAIKDEWNVLSSGTLFRYNSAGGIEKNPPFEIESQAPYWELETSGALPFNSIPECLIRWKPREIIFPARGKGPWILAFGNANCQPQGQGELLRLTGKEELEPAFFTGEKRYEKTELPELKENNYRVLILWIFLGAAVIILSLLAFTIARSMKR